MLLRSRPRVHSSKQYARKSKKPFQDFFCPSNVQCYCNSTIRIAPGGTCGRSGIEICSPAGPRGKERDHIFLFRAEGGDFGFRLSFFSIPLLHRQRLGKRPPQETWNAELQAVPSSSHVWLHRIRLKD